ncbi:FAD dependent oxidoreductase-domain-containing protein [Chytriomyces sp. MP71]|nr:FAD dependent oxidoreductase-domain-containing protein [Chytriomyces sp. MP71]
MGRLPGNESAKEVTKDRSRKVKMMVTIRRLYVTYASKIHATVAAVGGIDAYVAFDLLIVGGGATKVGCALDAATRGLSVALVERDDFEFATRTSSCSTKLVHGGVRYLDKTFKELDIKQYKLVVEALHERSIFLKIAPYLSYQLPIMLPVYQYWKLPYYFVGAKAYEFLAGSEGISRSYFLGKRKALEEFPMLKGDKLVGAMVYYDGAHNDSRMNVAIALTAVAHGAVVANHIEVVELIKNPHTTLSGKLGLGQEETCGAAFGTESYNATGPFSDGLRKVDSGITSTEIYTLSYQATSHKKMGLIDPETSNGRVIFFLPWQGNVIAGTTGYANPMPSEEDIAWILNEVENYLDPAIKRLLTLVRDPAVKTTSTLVRNHIINWTTYRAMAHETIECAMQVFGLEDKAGPCVAEWTLLIGTSGWSPYMFIKLIQSFGIETEVAQHLADSYGDHAWGVASMAHMTGSRWPIHGKRLTPQYPYIEAEVRYAVRREYACTVVDVIARRMRIAMLNAQATKEVLPRVIEIMAQELNWTKERQQKEHADALEFLNCMGLHYLEGISNASPEERTFYTRNHFVPEELVRYQREFEKVDWSGKGRIKVKDLGKVLKAIGVDGRDDPSAVAAKLEVGKNGDLEFGEFLEVLSEIKEKRQRSKFMSEELVGDERSKISTNRSGGGV